MDTLLDGVKVIVVLVITEWAVYALVAPDRSSRYIVPPTQPLGIEPIANSWTVVEPTGGVAELSAVSVHL